MSHRRHFLAFPLPVLLILFTSICYQNEDHSWNIFISADSSSSSISDTAASFSDRKRRLLRERLQSNVQWLEQQQSSSNGTVATIALVKGSPPTPPDKTTSTQHDRQTYSLIKDMEPLSDGNLLSHEDPEVAAKYVMDTIDFAVKNRLTQIFRKAKTPECRAKIGKHYAYFLSAIGKEKFLPFQSFPYELTNECPSERKYDIDNLPEDISIQDIQQRVYQPPPTTNETTIEEDNETSRRYKHAVEYIDDPKNLNLLYVILTHDNPNGTIRLVNSLYEEGHVFVIHVDGMYVKQHFCFFYYSRYR